MLYDWPKSYKNIVELKEGGLDGNINPLTIKRICNNILVEFSQTNLQVEARNLREDKEFLNVKPEHKGTCTTCGK